MAVLLVLAAGCSTPSGPGSDGRPGRTSPAAAPSSPVPTDAAGEPFVRPRCAEPVESTYLHAKGAGKRLTPVLLLGRGPRGVVVGAQANGGICQVLPFAQDLAAKGYHVAVFDWTMLQYADNMTTATKALIADGATKVVLGGFSRRTGNRADRARQRARLGPRQRPGRPARASSDRRLPGQGVAVSLNRTSGISRRCGTLAACISGASPPRPRELTARRTPLPDLLHSSRRPETVRRLFCAVGSVPVRPERAPQWTLARSSAPSSSSSASVATSSSATPR
ncbi:hypothetical protein [Dactylosporangium darangshiense]